MESVRYSLKLKVHCFTVSAGDLIGQSQYMMSLQASPGESMLTGGRSSSKLTYGVGVLIDGDEVGQALVTEGLILETHKHNIMVWEPRHLQHAQEQSANAPRQAKCCLIYCMYSAMNSKACC